MKNKHNSLFIVFALVIVTLSVDKNIVYSQGTTDAILVDEAAVDAGDITISVATSTSGTLITPPSPEGSFPYPTLVKLPGIGKEVEGRNVVMINPESIGILLKSFFNYLIGIALVLTVVMVIYGGVLYATSDAAGKKADGRKVIQDAFYGLALVLSSWLILYTINPDLLNFNVDIGRLELQESTKGGLGKEVEVAGGGGGFQVAANAAAGVGGSCTPPTNSNNPCHPDNLSKRCFGQNAQSVSRVCMLESSGGLTNVCSGSDKLNRGAGPSYSCGLWQINLTVHKVAGLNCPSAFTGKCGPLGTVGKSAGLKIGNCTQSIRPGMENLYNQCVAAAKNLNTSMDYACKLYSGRGNKMTDWAYSAKECNLPMSLR